MNNHTVEVSSNVARSDAHCFDSLHPQPLVTPRVASRIVAEFVGDSVYFNCETGSFAEEVQDKWSERVLPPELKPIWAQSQYPPEPDL